MPVLFRAAWCRPHFLTWDRFIARPAWPYVQYVEIINAHAHILTSFSCLSISGHWQYIDPARVDPDNALIPLADAFSQLPNVSQVKFRNTHGLGIPRTVLAIVLSIPGIRTLEVRGGLHHHESERSSPTALTFPVAPLTCYRQLHDDYRQQPRRSSGDMALLRYFASQIQLQQSLETLVILSEDAPLDELAAHDWPRLKLVSLRGELQPAAAPLISVFERMPALQELNLEIACTPATGRTLFCPSDWTGPCPWPKIRSLVVSHPHPGDSLYALLPHTLRRLVLRCWPRRYISLLWHERPYDTDLGWYTPILSSSEMLQILSRCPSPHLEELELEFEEDEHDLELFTLIPLAFPNLVTLTVFRYRQSGKVTVPVVSIPTQVPHLRRADRDIGSER